MKKTNESKTEIERQYFNLVSMVFLLLFLFYAMKNGFERGFKLSLFIWCLTVCTTPISTASILLSFPIKIFTTIPMFVTKFVSSMLGLGLLVYFYKSNYDLISKNPLGRAFIKIMQKNLYSLFVVSIVASVLSSYILDTLVDNFLLSVVPTFSKSKLAELLFVILAFICLNVAYFNILIKNKIFTIDMRSYFL
uniref:Uncharacterized protein n=1 Tax=viral metagenome TaxID=1070528 RepID=A0A6C0L1I6_9ZZZZ